MTQTITYRGYTAQLEDLPGHRQARFRIADNPGDPIGADADWQEVECRDFQELELIVKREIDNFILRPDASEPDTTGEDTDLEQALETADEPEEKPENGQTEGQQEPVQNPS